MSDSDPAKVAENDLRKLHAEVNQIVSQRFNLTTIAVIVFATTCGFATSASKDGTLTANFVSLIAILVLCILGALFAYFMLLLGMMRIFTVYIARKYKSPWEEDWAKYRRLEHSRRYWGYSRAGTVVFQILGALSIVFLWILWIVGKGSSNAFPPVFLVPAVFWLIYEVVIAVVTNFRDKIFNETKISSDWDKAIEDGKTGTEILKP